MVVKSEKAMLIVAADVQVATVGLPVTLPCNIGEPNVIVSNLTAVDYWLMTVRIIIITIDVLFWKR